MTAKLFRPFSAGCGEALNKEKVWTLCLLLLDPSAVSQAFCLSEERQIVVLVSLPLSCYLSVLM